MGFQFDQGDDNNGLQLERGEQEKKPAVSPFAKKPVVPAETPPPVGGLPVKKPTPATGSETPQVSTKTPFSLPPRPTKQAQEEPVEAVKPTLPSTRPKAPSAPVETAVVEAESEYVEPPQARFTLPTAPRQTVQEEPEDFSPRPRQRFDHSDPEPTPSPAVQYVDVSTGKIVDPEDIHISRVEPVQTPTPAVVERPEPQPLDSSDKKGKKKKKDEGKGEKKGFFSPRDKKEKKSPSEKKASDFAGERKKALYIKIGVLGVLGLTAFLGVRSLVMPDDSPSRREVAQYIETNLNFTGFPAESGAIFAQQFVRDYFTYNSAEGDQVWDDKMANYTSGALLADFGIIRPNAPIDNPTEQRQVDQKITNGPFIVATNNRTETSAVFTVKFAVNNGSWMYLNVPVKYDPADYSMTLAGPTSFTKAIQNVGSVESTDYTAPIKNNDAELVKTFEPDLKSYLEAWAGGSTTIIERYVDQNNATDDARIGLQGTVLFNSLTNLKIQAEADDNPSTKTARLGEFTVTWEDPITHALYPQQYRMRMTLNAEGNWTIQDIQNFAILN